MGLKLLARAAWQAGFPKTGVHGIGTVVRVCTTLRHYHAPGWTLCSRSRCNRTNDIFGRVRVWAGGAVACRTCAVTSFGNRLASGVQCGHRCAWSDGPRRMCEEIRELQARDWTKCGKLVCLVGSLLICQSGPTGSVPIAPWQRRSIGLCASWMTTGLPRARTPRPPYSNWAGYPGFPASGRRAGFGGVA